MAVVKWLLILIVALAAGLVVAGRLGYLRGTQPTDLGVRDGRLKPPSDTENSVTSQAALYPDHPQRHYAAIAPIELQGGDGPATMARIREVVEAMPGAALVEARPDYLYAQFTTKLMNFVDDTEFWFDPGDRVIHVRSASRIGRRDMGVNRVRVEAVREALKAAPATK